MKRVVTHRRCERYTTPEPSPWTELLARRATLLADAQQAPISGTLQLQLHQLRADCQRMQTKSLVPLIDEALCAIGASRSD